MKPLRIGLMRHSESDGNVNDEVYQTIPDHKLKITDNGVRQSFEAGEYSKTLFVGPNLFVYLSPYTRTKQTFMNWLRGMKGGTISNVQVREDSRIRERDWGHFYDAAHSKKMRAERKVYGKFYYRMEDGESCADVTDRLTTFLDTLHRDFEKEDYPENVLIVTHGETLRLLLMRWFKWPVEFFEKLDNPQNCGMVILDRKDEESLRYTGSWPAKEIKSYYKINRELSTYKIPDMDHQKIWLDEMQSICGIPPGIEMTIKVRE